MPEKRNASEMSSVSHGANERVREQAEKIRTYPGGLMPQNLVNHTGRTDLPALIGSNRAGGHSCLSGKDRCLFVEIPLRSRYARLTKQSHCSRAGTVTGRGRDTGKALVTVGPDSRRPGKAGDCAGRQERRDDVEKDGVKVGRLSWRKSKLTLKRLTNKSPSHVIVSTPLFFSPQKGENELLWDGDHVHDWNFLDNLRRDTGNSSGG